MLKQEKALLEEQVKEKDAELSEWVFTVITPHTEPFKINKQLNYFWMLSWKVIFAPYSCRLRPRAKKAEQDYNRLQDQFQLQQVWTN